MIPRTKSSSERVDQTPVQDTVLSHSLTVTGEVEQRGYASFQTKPRLQKASCMLRYAQGSPLLACCIPWLLEGGVPTEASPRVKAKPRVEGNSVVKRVPAAPRRLQ